MLRDYLELRQSGHRPFSAGSITATRALSPSRTLAAEAFATALRPPGIPRRRRYKRRGVPGQRVAVAQEPICRARLLRRVREGSVGRREGGGSLLAQRHGGRQV